MLLSVLFYRHWEHNTVSRTVAQSNTVQHVKSGVPSCKVRIREKKLSLLTNANVLIPIDTAHTTRPQPPVVIACICMTQLATVGGEHSRLRWCRWRRRAGYLPQGPARLQSCTLVAPMQFFSCANLAWEPPRGTWV